MNCARCVIEHLGVDLLPAEPGSLVFTDDLIEEHAGKGSPRSDRSTPRDDWLEKGGFAMPDLGLTHVALSVRDLDASIAFYEKYARMAVVHRRAREGVRSAWITDHTRPFVIVLVEAADQHDPPLGPFGHLGVACASREEIGRLYEEARREGRPTRAPIDAGDPVGYTARIADPDGHSLELSFGQEVGLTVEAATER